MWAAITAPIATSAGPVSVGASIGVLVLESWGGVPSTGTVLRHADEAAYLAKRSGGGYAVYAPEQEAQTLRRSGLAGSTRMQRPRTAAAQADAMNTTD